MVAATNSRTAPGPAKRNQRRPATHGVAAALLLLLRSPAVASTPSERRSAVVAANGLTLSLEAPAPDVYQIAVRASTNGAPGGPSATIRSAAGASSLEFDADGDRLILRAQGRESPVWSGTIRPLSQFGAARVPGLEIEWAATASEHLYGLGERFDSLDQRGKNVDVWIRDAPGQPSGHESYFCTPVLYSSGGWALFAADNPEGAFDLRAEGGGRHRYRRAGPDARLYLAAGDSLRDLLLKRARIQGPFRTIPDWAWGPWISRNSFENQDEAEEAIRGMIERGLPVAAIVQEAWKGRSESGEFNRFAPERWPRLEEYFRLCSNHGIRTVLWQVPVLHPSSPDYASCAEQGYFVKASDGSVRPRRSWLSGFANFDFTHPDAVRYWKDILRPLVRMGVSGFKADDGEDVEPEDLFEDGRRGWQLHNEYTVLYARAIAEVFEEEGRDGILWCRSAGLGSEALPALWAGDQFAAWDQLRCLVPAGLSAGLSGAPFWGHDIGGYLGDPSAELYVRWLQFGAFSPLMQYHGRRRREPWVFGEEAVRAYRLCAFVRMNLRPTLIALGRETAETGLPVMRPMILEFPEDPRFADEHSQYMLGHDLLVAPVMEEGAHQRLVRFPAGAWQHLLQPVSYVGPADVQVPLGMETVPVFVRQDAVLKVELDPEAELGAWRPGAPVREIRFAPDRVAIRNLLITRAPNVDSTSVLISFRRGPALAGTPQAWLSTGEPGDDEQPVDLGGDTGRLQEERIPAVAAPRSGKAFRYLIIRSTERGGHAVEVFRTTL